MRWKGETPAQREARYREGVWRLAWLPTQMDDGTWVWLEPFWEMVVNGKWGRRWRIRRISLTDAHAAAERIKREEVKPPPPTT